MHLVLTSDGKFKTRAYGSSTLTDIALPSGITLASPAQRPCFALYKRRTYINGQFTPNLLWTENSNLYASGILATSTAPTASIGAGTGITGSTIRYVYTMAEIVSGIVVHESDASSASTPIPTVVNRSINVAGLPTSHTNARVSHKRLYRSDNGGLHRFVANVAIVTATYSDSTATLALGAPVQENHGVPPATKFNSSYHDRLFYAGNSTYKYRLWFSEIGMPEAVGALSYIDTRDGEDITGIARCGDELIVFCPQSMYSVQGYTVSDFRMRKIDPSTGCISNASIVNIKERLFFASEEGVCLYDGSVKFLMEDLRDYWRDDYASNVSIYQDCQAIESRYHRGYKLLIPKDSTFCYFGHYDPVFRGEQPYWVFDTETRKMKTLGTLTPSAGAYRYDEFGGYCDGYIRKHNQEADNDDDGDSNSKQAIIQTGALLMGDPGGSRTEGKTFEELWSYVESEQAAWVLQAVGGDEDVINAATANNTTTFWKDSVAASASSGFTADSVHYHKPIQVSGRALCLKITSSGPIGLKYRGFGGVYGPGEATRPPNT